MAFEKFVGAIALAMVLLLSVSQDADAASSPAESVVMCDFLKHL